MSDDRPVTLWRLAAGMLTYLIAGTALGVMTESTALPLPNRLSYGSMVFGLALFVAFFLALGLSRAGGVRFVWAFIGVSTLIRLGGALFEASAFETILSMNNIVQIGDGAGILYGNGAVTPLGEMRIWLIAPVQAVLVHVICVSLGWWAAVGPRADWPGLSLGMRT